MCLFFILKGTDTGYGGHAAPTVTPVPISSARFFPTHLAPLRNPESFSASRILFMPILGECLRSAANTFSASASFRFMFHLFFVHPPEAQTAHLRTRL